VTSGRRWHLHGPQVKRRIQRAPHSTLSHSLDAAGWRAAVRRLARQRETTDQRDRPEPVGVEADGSTLEIRDLSLGCFAHDVRSPLTASRLALGALLATSDGGGDDRSLLEATERGLDAIEQLLEQVLDLDRLRAIPTVRDGTEVDLSEVAARAAAACSQPDRVDTLLVSSTVVGVPALLERALHNLVQNALDHGAERAEIVVGPAADGVLVLVDDDGEGVPVADRSLVFEPFVRLAQDSGRGVGLGLALVRRIATLHGGTVWVENSPLGGARFGLWIPSCPSAA
jgi:signal transduction histidine kinase